MVVSVSSQARALTGILDFGWSKRHMSKCFVIVLQNEDWVADCLQQKRLIERMESKGY